MHRATCLASLLAFASLAAFADDRSKIAAAVRDAVEQKVGEEKKPDGDSLLVRIIDALASEDEEVPPLSRVYYPRPTEVRGRHHGRADTSAETLSLATCPFGTDGTKTHEELRYYYRDHTDDELWKLCLNRDSAIDLNSGACACALLASPQPWRPVATPHDLEQGDAPPPEPEHEYQAPPRR